MNTATKPVLRALVAADANAAQRLFVMPGSLGPRYSKERLLSELSAGGNGWIVIDNGMALALVLLHDEHIAAHADFWVNPEWVTLYPTLVELAETQIRWAGVGALVTSVPYQAKSVLSHLAADGWILQRSGDRVWLSKRFSVLPNEERITT